jgi:hypothetical protein
MAAIMSELELETTNTAAARTTLNADAQVAPAFYLSNTAPFGMGLESNATVVGVSGSGQEADVDGSCYRPADGPHGTRRDRRGCQGDRNAGVFGRSEGAEGLGKDYGVKVVSGSYRGVWGSSVSGEGVFGYSHDSNGVDSQSDGAIGVYGQASSSYGIGVRGISAWKGGHESGRI